MYNICITYIALIITIFLLFLLIDGLLKYRNVCMDFFIIIFCVLWNNMLSHICNISSGLLQSNRPFSSPEFFNAYTDELFYKLQESGLGCKLC